MSTNAYYGLIFNLEITTGVALEPLKFSFDERFLFAASISGKKEIRIIIQREIF
jgi:hypothetical protein